MLKKQVFVGLLVAFLSLGLTGVVLAESGAGINPFSDHFNNSDQAQPLQASPTVEQTDLSVALLPTGLGLNELDASDVDGAATRNLAQNQTSEAVAQSEVPVALLPTGLGMSELDARDLSGAAIGSEGADKNRPQTLCSTASGSLNGKISKNCGDAMGG
jgi:hypothetical protein